MASTIRAPKRPARPGATQAPARPGATQAPAKPATAPKRPAAPAKPMPKRIAKPAPVAAAIDMTKVKVVTEWVDINDITPYVFNARDNSKAIGAVAKSIQTFGFIVPVVIDAEGNLAAGHTRVEAAKSLGMAEVLAVRAEHLTTEQIDAFRLVDNKVSEIADWNTDLLGPELARLEGIVDFTDYGWSQEEIDCLSSVVASDCLNVSSLVTASATQAPEEGEGGLSIRRGPQTTRLVLGELVIFIPSNNYRDWIDGIQRLHNFNKSEIEADILNRLGLMT